MNLGALRDDFHSARNWEILPGDGYWGFIEMLDFTKIAQIPCFFSRLCPYAKQIPLSDLPAEVK